MIVNRHTASLTGVLLLAATVILGGAQAKQHDEHAAHDMHAGHHMHGMSGDEHAAHRAMMKQRNVRIIKLDYTVPNVKLIDHTGQVVELRSLLAGDKAVAVNFIFTTCTTICPVMTATFAQMRKALGPDAKRIRLVSITIDPEHDTPSTLANYANRFHAPRDWRFLTGSPRDVEKVLRNFDAWTGSKTNHKAVTLLRGQPGKQWVRVEGLGSGTVLAEQARQVLH